MKDQITPVTVAQTNEMSLADAQTRAASLGLEAIEFAGWRCLFPLRGGAFVSRAQTWEEAFERIEAAAVPGDPALATACPRCHAKAGERCRNYLGQNKPACRARTEPESEPEPSSAPPAQQFLFD